MKLAEAEAAAASATGRERELGEQVGLASCAFVRSCCLQFRLLLLGCGICHYAHASSEAIMVS